MQHVAAWETWDEPDRQIAVAQWSERDVAVVFPLHWAACYGQGPMIARAKERIQDVEAKSGRTLVPGSVLLAFSEHDEQPRALQLAPDILRRLV